MKKPSLAVLIGMGGKHDEGADDHGDEDQAYTDAGEQAMHDLKKGDANGFADAVCALVDLHTSSKDGGEHDEEDHEDVSKEY